MNEQLQKQFQRAHEAVERSEYILLAGHANPDGDSIGSALGFRAALEDNFNKHVMLYAQDAIPPSFSFLKGADLFSPRVPWFPDLVVGFDYGDFERLGLPEGAIEGARTITFDHHLPAGQRGDVRIIDTSFSSTAELLYTFMRAVGWHLSRTTAHCLLTGILTDTGAFAHNTSARTLKVAGELLQYGVPMRDIYLKTFADKSPHMMNVWGDLLQKIVHNTEYGFVSVAVPFQEFKKYGIVLDDLTGMVSVLNAVADARFAIFVVEYEPGKVKGSLRSEEFKGVDVSKIAKQLGGGGHRYAAGFTLKGSLEEAQARIAHAVRKDRVPRGDRVTAAV
jgi:bifunctional oligoribonuclease and PAP phosphatase NrnA